MSGETARTELYVELTILLVWWLQLQSALTLSV